MVRTQLYLTEKEREELAALSKITGRKQSELIREALDRFLQEAGPRMRQVIVDRAAGMWREREDLPDFRRLRDEWDRA